MKTVGSLFSPTPLQWGLRGHPPLWKDMARVFRPVPLPDSVDTMRLMLEGAFLALTTRQISTVEDTFYVERYARGGMSSGRISPEFWRERGFPLIIERFIAYRNVAKNVPSVASL